MTYGIEDAAVLHDGPMDSLRVPLEIDLPDLGVCRLGRGDGGELRVLERDDTPLIRSIGVVRDEAFVRAQATVARTKTGLRFQWDAPDETIRLSIGATSDGLALDLALSIRAHRPARVKRDAIVLEAAVPLRWAARPNGALIDVDDPTPVWLGNGSVAFGDGAASFGVIGPGEFSSLQYDPQRGRLWINLDFAYDHPHVSPSESANWEDDSAVEYPAESVRGGAVRVERAAALDDFPRAMTAPNGAQALFVWTEHACHCALQTHRAVYFGDETIESAKAATGGFVKHRIPVTKSVFFANVSAEKNWVREAVIDAPMVAIEGNPAFLNYLLELHRTGLFEIVPHGVQPQTSDRSLFERAAMFMRETFGAVSWIDHSTFRKNWISGGRDSYLAYGAQPGRAEYRGDIWKANGFKYFWNHALEFLERVPAIDTKASAATQKPSKASLLKHALKRALDILAPGLSRAIASRRSDNKGHDLALDQLSVPRAWPFPLWWRNASATGEFINWSTRSTIAGYFRPGEGELMRRRLDGLVAAWGVDLHHCYPTRVEAGNATWMRDADGRFIVNPEFDAVLAHMARLRDEGSLHIGLIRDVVPHWTGMAMLRVRRNADGNIILKNTGATAIFGATFALRSGVPTIDGRIPPHRRVGQDTLFWIDLPAHAEAILVRHPQTAAL